MEKNLVTKDGNKITSLDLVKQINIFREQEGDRVELQHKTLLEIIRDEFEEEISQQNILPSTYKNERGREYPMFELTLSQAKQVLMRESKFVRKAMIKYIEKLEGALQQISDKERFLLGLFSKDPMIVADSHKRLVELETKPLQQKILEQKPKVEFVDDIMEEDKYFDGSELAKMLNINGYGRNNLMAYMRENKILNDFNAPYQQWVSGGYCKQIPVVTNVGVRMKTLFSIRMLAYLNKKLRKK